MNAQLSDELREFTEQSWRRLIATCRMLMSLAFYSTIICSCCTICLSIFFLVYVETIRNCAPPWKHFETPMVFDYRSPAAIARVDLSSFKTLPTVKTKPGTFRKLKPFEKIDIDIRLWVAPNDDQSDVFHLRVGLLSLNESLLEESMQLVDVPKRTPLIPLFWSLMTGRIRLKEWRKGYRDLRLPLFRGYQEKVDKPLLSIQTVLERRFGGKLPVVVRSQLHVTRNLGLREAFFFSLRPRFLPVRFWSIGASVVMLISTVTWYGASKALSWIHPPLKKDSSHQTDDSADSAESTNLRPESPPGKSPQIEQSNLRHRAKRGT